MRHGIHVKETLHAATRSLDAIRQHQEMFHNTTKHVSDSREQRLSNIFGRRLEFQLRFLMGLLDRCEANNARIQNEITLVSLRRKTRSDMCSSRQQALNVAAQGSSKIQLQIGHEAKREASAMKAIAVVTMAFLPATFVSVGWPIRLNLHTLVNEIG